MAGKFSHQLAIEPNISSHTLLLNWLKSYQAFGIMGLQPKPKGRKAMSYSNNQAEKQANKQN